MEDVMAQATSTWAPLNNLDVFCGLTVGEVVDGSECGCKLLSSYDLGDVASAFYSSGQTAAVVTDGDGNLIGLMTETDIVRAYWEGASPDMKLVDWLGSSEARGQFLKLHKLIVSPQTLLAEVADMMVQNAISGDCACHHVVVQGPVGPGRALSSHDIVRAFCRPGMWDRHHQGSGSVVDAETAANMTVEYIMKPRESVITCPPSSTMQSALGVLLMTHQDSALIVDDDGIYGIVTPRDAVKAFSEAVPNSILLTDWLLEAPAPPSSRIISCDSRVVVVAATMAEKKLNHLVVVKPNTMEAIGTVSSLDVVLATTVPWPVQPTTNPSIVVGPLVGELVKQPGHKSLSCKVGSTLVEAAELFVSSGATSATLALSGECSSPTLVTENDILQAFLGGCSRTSSLEAWLFSQEQKRPTLPAHLLVAPSVSLGDAATLMLLACTAHPQRSRHHLVVQGGDDQSWLGVFSALDVARALSGGLCSEAEKERICADETTVSMLMKPIERVPKVKAADTLQWALSSLLAFGQNAAVVVDENGLPCLDGVITPRCAMEALADGIPLEKSVAHFMQTRRKGKLREVKPDTKLNEAAALMAQDDLHHLVVAEIPCASDPIGVFSALDLVRGVASIKSHIPFVSLAWLRLCKESPVRQPLR